ncbi:MAG: flagellar basal body L-ring protein FlgH [Alphaproteobacteria bacterium]|nr:flagellar basal body L-ring protein FlgH [Alphaproteobacteria bacterium]
MGACANTIERLENIGQTPGLSPIAVPANIAAGAPVILPQPAPEKDSAKLNSLWRPGSRSFFRDPRAAKTGDILTVNIDIGDQAKIANSTSRSSTASENASASNFLGLESRLKGFLPDAVDPSSLVDLGSDSSNTGTGSVDRSESITLTVAAVITQALPNGNLVIQGQQEVRVNNEVRELLVSGVVRPEDISSANTIAHTQIAEARICYGGRGQITDVQQPRYGQQFFDIVWPF